MASVICVDLASELEEKQPLLFWMDFHPLVCGFHVQAECQEVDCTAVAFQSRSDGGEGRVLHTFVYFNPWIDIVHGGVED
jgi:hypothetical protein